MGSTEPCANFVEPKKCPFLQKCKTHDIIHEYSRQQESTAHSTKTSLLHHILHLDPLLDHPKSSIGCIKIICGGWEAMVLLFCWLVAWIMAHTILRIQVSQKVVEIL
jgi:hypothetical protein